MELDPDDNKKVIDLLSKLKNTGGAYPSDILASRRQNYLKQVANIGLGIGVGAGLKNAAKGGNSSGTIANATSKILETALVAAIVIEAGTVAYLYRDKIAEMVRTYTNSSNVQEVVTQPEENVTSAPESINLITTILVIPSVTPSGTPSPVSTIANSNENSAGLSVDSTPSPNGNNGNHFGQTPKPERPNGNNNTGGGNGNGNDKKP